MADPTIRAAGAVLWRPGLPSGDDPPRPEFALVHRPARQDWSLPKGKLERGEGWAAAAVREVHEETGRTIALGRPLQTLHYDVEGEPKQVRYWAARTERDGPPFVPTAEVDELVWLPYAQARAQLTYPHDAHLLREVVHGPLETTPIVVLRHGKAVKRAAWAGTDDGTRPLEARGEAQARRLVPMLAAFGVEAILSSDATRCRDTVLPYADSEGIDLVDEHLLSEEGHEEHSRDLRHLARDLAGDSRRLLLCSHRPVLPDLLGELLHRWKGRRPSPLGPGAFLVIHRDLSGAAPVVVEVERHRP